MSADKDEAPPKYDAGGAPGGPPVIKDEEKKVIKKTALEMRKQATQANIAKFKIFETINERIEKYTLLGRYSLEYELPSEIRDNQVAVANVLHAIADEYTAMPYNYQVHYLVHWRKDLIKPLKWEQIRCTAWQNNINELPPFRLKFEWS